MSDPRAQELIAELCLLSNAGSDLSAKVKALIEAANLPAEDAAILKADADRLLWYRRLVRNNLEGVIESVLERTKLAFSNFAPSQFERLVNEFLAVSAPRTHYLRDVPLEFFEFAEPRWRSLTVPLFLVNFARFELVEFAAGTTIDPPRKLEPVVPTPDRGLVFANAARLEPFDFPVHAFVDNGPIPSAKHTNLLFYRDGEHVVRTLELTPLAASIVKQLIDHKSIKDSLAAALESEGRAFTPAIVSQTAELFAGLSSRGVVIGVADAQA